MQQHAPVSFVTVSIEGDFWRERLETVLTRTIPYQHAAMEAAGMFEQLAVAKPPPDIRLPADEHGFTPQVLWDAEIGKWLEAASYALAFRRQPTMEGQIETIAGLYAKAQLEDGYLDTWFIARAPEKRWTNLRDDHELHVAGHLIEAAVAHFQATGEQTLIEPILKLAAHIGATFGPGEEQKHGYDGHQGIELALIRLHGVTKDEKHLDFASYFIDARGQLPNYFAIEALARGDEDKPFARGSYSFNQSHRPVRNEDTAVGHVTRAFTMYAAMACLAGERRDGSLQRAVEALWADVTGNQMYVTGGVGQNADGTFGPARVLPNETARAETSAAVALVHWAKRMLTLELDGKYADVLELALYNGALAGLSRDGEHYFDTNPLAADATRQRWAWSSDPGAATNIARLVASVGGLFYSVAEDGIAIHLYGGASATVSVGGRAVSIKEISDYPWSGKINITIDPVEAGEFTLRLRIPAYARDARARINGAGIDLSGNLVRGYLEIRRTWNPGDTVDLDLPMAAERIYAHPAVAADSGRVALRRGPLVYCFEAVDNPAPLSVLRVPRQAALATRERPDLFGGIVTIVVEGAVSDAGAWGGELYRSDRPAGKPTTWTAVPYYLNTNREPGDMRVWVAED
ncbi:MAG: beta-L-arabinofuranosidase domain-containing protein [Bauldia sp.]